MGLHVPRSRATPIIGAKKRMTSRVLVQWLCRCQAGTSPKKFRDLPDVMTSVRAYFAALRKRLAPLVVDSNCAPGLDSCCVTRTQSFASGFSHLVADSNCAPGLESCCVMCTVCNLPLLPGCSRCGYGLGLRWA